MKGTNLWTLLKDVILTGTGAAVIVSQMFSQHPSDALLATGLALTVPTIADHARSVISGASSSARREPQSSGESASASQSPSSGP